MLAEVTAAALTEVLTLLGDASALVTDIAAISAGTRAVHQKNRWCTALGLIKLALGFFERLVVLYSNYYVTLISTFRLINTNGQCATHEDGLVATCVPSTSGDVI